MTYHLSSDRSSHRRCSAKKVFLEISQNSQEKTCARVSFLINSRLQACNFIKKETLAMVFSCEFCEISKSTFSYRAPPVVASVLSCDICLVLILKVFFIVLIPWLHGFLISNSIFGVNVRVA